MRFSISAVVLAVASTAVADLTKASRAAAYEEAITRRPDSFWDHIVKGADVQAASKKPGAHKRLEGELANYQLRVRQNDPATLGVDTVKQLSGYLDDEAADKHLFYCRSIRASCTIWNAEPQSMLEY